MSGSVLHPRADRIAQCNENFTLDQTFPYCSMRENFFRFLLWKSKLSERQNATRS
jgi:hypothetical protein